MPMVKSVAAANPDAYVAALTGWRKRFTQALRGAILEAAPLEEGIKWRNLVYFSRGPVVVVRAEEERVLVSFFRGQRLRDMEPRLKPGGKYEMATLIYVEATPPDRAKMVALVKAAVALNKRLGDPTKLAGAA